jgi:hypothetical protein
MQLPLLTDKISERWPKCLPDGRADLEVIQHLTVTDGAQRRHDDTGPCQRWEYQPIEATVSRVTLVAFNGQVWVPRHELPLGAPVTCQESTGSVR